MTAPSFRVGAATYLALTFVWSLGFWALAAMFGGYLHPPGWMLFYVGGAGPLVAALIVVHVLEPPPAGRELWSRTFDVRRTPPGWLAVALVIHPLIVLAAVVVDIAIGGAPAVTAGGVTGPGALLLVIAFVLVFGPLPEEMGWRGVALDRLQARMSPTAASLVLGAAWAAWHVPLFLMEGTFQHGLGFGGLRFWIFMADLIPLTVIMTWIYNRAGRSVLTAVLVHFTGNLGGAFLDKSARLALLELAGLAVVAVVVVAREGAALGLGRGTDARRGVTR